MKTALRWLPAILHASLLFALSSQPDLRLATEPVLDAVLRKLGHLGAYALLAIFVAYALGGIDRDRRARLALAMVIAYAVSDEAHQAFVPGREPALLDVAIDGVGGVLGLVAARFVGARWASSEGRVAGVSRSTYNRGGREVPAPDAHDAPIFRGEEVTNATGREEQHQ